jgi:REP element-mobilizing transposase RayT
VPGAVLPFFGRFFFPPCPQVAGLTELDLQIRFSTIIITDMSKLVGFMATWTAYGTWLPGDERGFVEDAITCPGNFKTFERNKQRQKSPPVKLNARQRESIKQTILNESQKIGHKIEALLVCAYHVHLVARPHSQDIEDVVGRYKSLTTRALWQSGRKGRIWTKGFDKRFCFSERELTAKIKYVQKHNSASD